ncbi:MAG: nucleoside transporter C-terminal domain-containing protein [Bacteroidota bacterium]
MDLVSIGRGLLGLVGILAIAFLLSSDRRRVSPRTVLAGLGLQIVFAILFLKGNDLAEVFAPFGWPKAAFAWVASLFVAFLQAVEAGATFVFGTLALSPGAEGSLGFFFFAYVLPTVIVFASLMSILYYLGIMQKVVQGVAWVVRRALGTSGPESLSVSANIFVGQTEAPLVIKPYIKNLSRSELMAVMTGGMATIAGGVLASYIAFLGERYAAVNNVAVEVGQQIFAEQLLGASVMAAPAALILAKILIPEKTPVEDFPAATPEADAGEATFPSTASDEAQEAVEEALEDAGPKNIIDAAASGAADGMQLALNIGAMLIAFLALIAIVNGSIGWVIVELGGTLPEGKGALDIALGYILAPVAWLIGVPNADLLTFGGFLGTKVIANEFVAYSQFADALGAGSLDPKTVVMATFALCGFANLSSIGIQIGGIGPLAPERTGEIASLGLRAVLAGTLANLMTATIAGVLLG